MGEVHKNSPWKAQNGRPAVDEERIRKETVRDEREMEEVGDGR